ncbi:integrase catalytic domain-containing protein [Reichenbachiella sp.]|uniref:integrase catalytic domain-containing protein n=1 Tax=Reichenbachiella sp. TaxID=2184521 RepID=UPI003B5C2E18
MPKAYNNKVYMTFSELVSLELNSSGRIKNLISSGHKNFTSVKDPEDSRCTLIQYETLSTKYKAAIKELIGDPYAIIAQDQLDTEQNIKEVSKADISIHWQIDPAEYKEISSLDIWDRTDPATPAKIMTLAKAGAICRWYNNTKPTQAKKLGYDSKPDLLKAIQTHPDVKVMDGFWVASDRFQRKFVAYKKDKIKGLLPKSLQNTNNLKLKTDEQKETLRRLHASHVNRDFVWIADEYNVVAKLNHWPLLSETTVRDFLTDGDNQLQGILMRKGVKAFKSDAMPVKHRERPTCPGYLWEGDGTPWELYYQETKEVKGKEVTTYWNRKVVYMVTDGYNDIPLGWAIGESENIELIASAWKNAIFNTGLLPWQIRTDNYARKTMGELYNQVAKYFTPAQVGNARTKMIEHVFGQFSATRILKKYPNWSGCNITNRTDDNQPNREFLVAEKKAFPTESEVIDQINESINEYRNSLIKKSGLNRFEDWVERLRETEQLRIATHETLIDIFGVYRKRTNSFDNEGLTLIVDGEELHYMDWGKPENNGTDIPAKTQQYKELFGANGLRVKYLPEDLNMIRVDHPTRKKAYYLPATVKTPGCIMDAKQYPDKQEMLYQKLRFDKVLIGEVIQSHAKTIQVTNEVLSSMSVDAEGVMKTMFTVDGSNKQYLNEAQSYMKSLDKRIEDRAMDTDLYDDEISEEVLATVNDDTDLYD